MEKTVSIAKVKEARKRDALALAELIYDMYKEEEHGKDSIIEDGQNDAQPTQDN